MRQSLMILLAICVTTMTYAQQLSSKISNNDKSIIDLYSQLNTSYGNLFLSNRNEKIDIMDLPNRELISNVNKLVADYSMTTTATIHYDALAAHMGKGKLISEDSFYNLKEADCSFSDDEVAYANKFDSFFRANKEFLIGDEHSLLTNSILSSKIGHHLTEKGGYCRNKLMKVVSAYECKMFYLIVYMIEISEIDSYVDYEVIIK